MKLIIGKALKMRREKKGIKQRAFAEMIGISAQHYSAVEQEKYPLPTKHWDKVEEVLGVSIEQLKEENRAGDSLPTQGNTVPLEEYRKIIAETTLLQEHIKRLTSIFNNSEKKITRDQLSVYEELEKLDRPDFYKRLYGFLRLSSFELLAKLELLNAEDLKAQHEVDKLYEKATSDETRSSLKGKGPAQKVKR